MWYVRSCSAAYRMHLKSMAVDGFIIFTALVQPLMVAFVALFVLRNRAADDLIYVVVGSGMTGIWSVLMFTSTFGVEAERWSGTLELVVGSPTPLQVIILGRILASVTLSLGSMVVSYGLAAILFRTPIAVAHPLAFVISILVCVVALAAFGLLLAPLMALNLSLSGWSNALEFPVYILGGFLFPIAMLPAWSLPVSYLLSPYWAARALHLTSSGGAGYPGDLLWSVAAMAVLGVLYVAGSAWLFEVVLRRVRISATLALQ